MLYPRPLGTVSITAMDTGHRLEPDGRLSSLPDHWVLIPGSKDRQSPGQLLVGLGCSQLEKVDTTWEQGKEK